AFIVATYAVGCFVIPKNFPGLPVDTQSVQRFCLVVAARDKNFVAENHWGSRTGSRQFELPRHVVLRPLRRQTLLRRGAVEVRSAPLSPVRTESGDDSK